MSEEEREKILEDRGFCALRKRSSINDKRSLEKELDKVKEWALP